MLRRAVSRLVNRLKTPPYTASSSPNDEAILYGLIGVNLGVFAAWQTLSTQWMTRHFTLSVTNLREGRWHTVVTHAFSHFDVMHLGTNMIGLYFAGRMLNRVLGSIRLYVASSLSSAASDLAFKHWTYRSMSWKQQWMRSLAYRDAPTLGASGAVNGLVALFCCLFPKEIIYINFIIPVPAFLLGILFVLHDFSSLKSAVGR